MGWVDHAPIWAIGLAMWAAGGLVQELCYRAGRRFSSHQAGVDGKGYLVSSSLALMGFMTAFTFGSAQTIFRQRQDLVVAEANALSSTYLLSQVLPAPWCDTLGRQMLKYADARAAFDDAGGGLRKVALATAQTTAQQKRIWATVSDEERSGAIPTLNGPLAQSANTMFDLAASRRAALDTRTPTAVLRMLALAGLVASGIVGFARAADRRYVVITGLVILIQTMAFCLILDLDRPFSSAIQINRMAMDRAIADIRGSEAAKAAVARAQNLTIDQGSPAANGEIGRR
jgi:hypothetical protein